MKRSTDRILTTHVGSLVRPLEIIEAMMRKNNGEAVDEAALQELVRNGVKDVVRKQAEAGIDIPSDGEYSKESFSGYMTERLGGLASRPVEPRPASQPMNYPILNEEFPGFMAQYNSMFTTMWLPMDLAPELRQGRRRAGGGQRTVVAGPIHYTGQQALQRDLTNFKDAMQGLSFAEGFVPAATPSRNDADPNQIYPSEQAYRYAMADAMHEEYKAITDAGFIVQLDLGLPARNQVLPGETRPSWEKLREASMKDVDAYNHALRGIPEDKVRYHLCWGSMNTPHTSDVPLREIVDIILSIHAQAYSIEAANPRHEHEWMVWEDIKLPEGKILIPGIVSHQTNVVEHPELVAWRIENYASVVGRENVIAGTDCGFSQGFTTIRVHPEVQWAKLKALSEGAALASKKLWGRN